MGVRENKVEKYLDTEFKNLGGLTRKWTSPGRDGVPDRICIVDGFVIGIEVKCVDGKLSLVQCREHTRLRECGMKIITVFGVEGVRKFIDNFKRLIDGCITGPVETTSNLQQEYR